jgi:acyl carrier protein phosphodiesterase
MNYLAHAYLSFNQPEILVGNMISDYVKGKKQYDFAVGIQKGIRLHRAIDHFTDTHAATKIIQTFFKPHYGLYSGAFADVVYDHFLANDPDIFTSTSLQAFATGVYTVLQTHSPVLPQKFAIQLPYMATQNWLYKYRFEWGIERSLEGLVRRALYLHDSKMAFRTFMQYYSEIQTAYRQFFPELMQYVQLLLNEGEAEARG